MNLLPVYLHSGCNQRLRRADRRQGRLRDQCRHDRSRRQGRAARWAYAPETRTAQCQAERQLGQRAKEELASVVASSTLDLAYTLLMPARRGRYRQVQSRSFVRHLSRQGPKRRPAINPERARCALNMPRDAMAEAAAALVRLDIHVRCYSRRADANPCRIVCLTNFASTSLDILSESKCLLTVDHWLWGLHCLIRNRIREAKPSL